MDATTLAYGILKDVVQIVIETAQENPITVAKITSDIIEVAEGYRIRIKPNYDNR